MKFLVCSRREVEALSPITDVNHAFISVRTPGDPDEVRLPRSEKTKASYHLDFHDIDLPGKDVTPEYLAEISKLRLFDESMAEMLLGYIEKWSKTLDLELIVVHCDAGISRSPAIAAALERTIFNGDDAEFFEHFHPNRRVYQTILRTFDAKFRSDGMKENK